MSTAIYFILPLIFIVIGFIFLKWSPTKVHWWCGYRTKRFMQNEETWNFANIHFARRLLLAG